MKVSEANEEVEGSGSFWECIEYIFVDGVNFDMGMEESVAEGFGGGSWGSFSRI